MKLKRVQIAGYRSIGEELELFLDGRVTVILGANDHGKTNLLQAIAHLNLDNFFLEDDINWDASENRTELPRVTYLFDLAADEREAVFNQWRAAFESQGRTPDQEHVGDDVDGDQGESVSDDDGDETEGDPLESVGQLGEDKRNPIVDGSEPSLALVPYWISFVRAGIGSGLEWGDYDTEPADDLLFEAMVRVLDSRVSRVELIDPSNSLNDSVGQAELIEDQNEFMQGIFYSAGLDPLNSEGLFNQDNQTTMKLDEASKALDQELTQSWAQGRDSKLRFQLRHKGDRIELQLQDPSVTSTYVRAARRSSGFTHFFTMSMGLNARRQKQPTGSYIWLFDEPGVFLHATGQRDLIQVLETLSETSQIAYATHSLFMINRNFPSRHRLVLKDASGTRLDGKPFVAQWNAVLEQLGLALPGTILFAPNVLLCEGDTDPIFIHSMLQFSINYGNIRFDINGFSALSTGTSKNADVLVEILTSAPSGCRLAALFDGDEGGKKRMNDLKPKLESHDFQSKVLEQKTTIEDHLPVLRPVYVNAVANYLRKLAIDKGVLKDEFPDTFHARVISDFDKKFDKPGSEKGVAQWAAQAGGLTSELLCNPSKVGIAREYVVLLQGYSENAGSTPIELKDIKRAVRLAEWIGISLELPTQSSQATGILNEVS